MLTFCTLFDSNYLDKGLVLQHSLENVMTDYTLYILAMDDKCYNILSDIGLNNTVIISLSEFEDEELLEIKKQRSRAEYCWTCSANLIDYVFETYHESYCTYIDSDLFFYKNPKILIFDDATSALDLATEARLYKALKEYMNDVTIILIAQRVASAKGAEKIIVLDDGVISGIGTSNELLENNEIYKDIYYSQLKANGGEDYAK